MDNDWELVYAPQIDKQCVEQRYNSVGYIKDSRGDFPTKQALVVSPGWEGPVYVESTWTQENCWCRLSQKASCCQIFKMSDKKAEAVKAKAEGNKHFKAKDFDKAIESYTKAIELDPEKVGGD